MNLSVSQHRSVHITSIGAFGHTTAIYLKRLLPEASHELRIGEEAATASSWPHRDVHVLASSRPAERLCASLSDICFQRATCLVPVILDSAVLQVGPIIIPGASGCWRCWSLRRQQHEVHPAEQSARAEFYENAPDAEPKGFLQPLATLAAAIAAESVAGGAANARGSAGSIWSMNIFTKEVVTGRLIGVHGCKWCGIPGEAGERTYGDLRLALDHLWRRDSPAPVEALRECESLETRIR